MEQPPYDMTPAHRSYFARVLYYIEGLIQNAVNLDVLTALPAKPVKGRLYYFDNVIGTTITSKGYWGYDGSIWVKLG